MEDTHGYIQLVIAATYSVLAVIASRQAGEAQKPRTQPEPGPHERHSRFHPETICLLAVSLSHYVMAIISVGH